MNSMAVYIDDFGDFGEVRQAKLTYRLYRIRSASAILQIPGQRDKPEPGKLRLCYAVLYSGLNYPPKALGA